MSATKIDEVKQTGEAPWYSQLRDRWQPEQVELLMIAESAPDDRGDVAGRRFFYADNLGADNLFRGVVEAMYGATKDDLKLTGKRPWLERLRADGFFLIDLAPFPVNGLRSAERRQALLEAVPDCVARASALAPQGVVVVKTDLYAMLTAPLQAEGLCLLQTAPIVFPLGNTRAQFVEQLRSATSRV